MRFLKQLKPMELLLWGVVIVGAPVFSGFDSCAEIAYTDDSKVAQYGATELQEAVCNGFEEQISLADSAKYWSCVNYVTAGGRVSAGQTIGEVRDAFLKQYVPVFRYIPPPPPDPDDDTALFKKAHDAGGSTCSPIAFTQPITQFLLDADSTGKNVTLMLYRQSDGSFSATGFSINNNVATSLGTMPQAQTLFRNCNTAPWPTVPHPSVLGVIPGTSSRNAIVTNLGGPLPYASVNIGPTTVKVSLDSQNTFGQKITAYKVNGTTLGVLAADFNGDGKVDIAVLNAGDTNLYPNSTGGYVSVLLGNGDGTLKAAANYPVGTNPTSMTWFDFNNDGRADLAVTNKDSHDVTVYLGKADGTLSLVATYPVPGSSADGINTIVAGDFDGDGVPDLIDFSAHSFYLLHGNGDGTFALKPQMSGYQTLSYTPTYLAAADVNKDGKLDLISVNYDATVSILLNAGDGSFPTQTRYVAGTPLTNGSAWVPGVFVMDFNDDGNPDLVFAAGHPDALQPDPVALTVLFGNGDGTFQGPPAVNVGYSATAMVTADFNGDGRPDIVLASYSFTSPTGNSLWLIPGRSGGGLQPPTEIPIAATANWVATADMNGDGFADLITVDYTNITVRLGNGDGTFQKPQTYPSGKQGGYAGSFVTVGDVNGDGLPDLVVAYGVPSQALNLPTSVVVFLAKPGGGFNAGTPVPAGLNTLQVALADVNGDGKLDLIAANVGNPAADTPVAGNVSVLLGNGDGTFQTPVNYTVGFAPTSLAVADLNGDGKSDLIVGTLGGKSPLIGVMLGVGDGTFGAKTFFNTYAYPGQLTLADFDHDGNLDLAIVHYVGDNPTSVMRGNGDGTFQAETLIMSGDTPVAAVAGDFSATGRPDLAVVTNPSSIGAGSVGLFQNVSLGGAVSAQPQLSITPVSYALDFGFVAPSKTADLKVTLSNIGGATLSVTSLSIDTSQFTIVSPASSSLPLPIASGASTDVTVRFTPDSAKAFTGNLTITTDPANPPATVKLYGTGISGTTSSPSIKVTPTSLPFGNVTVGQTPTMTVMITNAGGGTLTVSALSQLSAPFSLVSPPGVPFNVPSTGTTLTVRYSPTSAVASSATLNITSNGSTTPVQVSMSGTGTASTGSGGSGNITSLKLEAGSYSANANPPFTVGSTILWDTDNTSKNWFLGVSNTGSFSNPLLNPNKTVNLPVPPNSYYLYAWPFSLGNDMRLTVGWSNGATDVAYFHVDGTNAASTNWTREGTTGANLSLAYLNPGPSACHVNTTAAAPGCSASNYIWQLTVTGTSGGTPPATGGITVTPTSLDFGTVTVGQTSQPKTFTVTNGGSSPVTVSLVTSAPFAVSPASLTIPANGSAQGSVTFSPTSAGSSGSAVYITPTGATSPAAKVALSGSGAAATTGVTTYQLVADSGTFDQLSGFPGGTATGYFVNRMTPPAYPATLRSVQIVFFNQASGLASGAPINVVSGANPSGSANINGVALTTTPSTVGTLGGFDSYTVPSITITSGDFVVGFWVPDPPNVYPMAEDTQSGSKFRSYISTDGVNFTLIDTLGIGGNYGIRCIVDVGQ